MKGIFLRKYYESLMDKSVPYTQTSEIRKSLIEEYEKKLLDSGWKLCISEGGVVSPDLTTIFYTCRQPYIGQIMSYSVDHKAFRRCIKTLLQSGDFIEVKYKKAAAGINLAVASLFYCGRKQFIKKLAITLDKKCRKEYTINVIGNTVFGGDKMLVERLKTKYNTNEPIFTSEILEMFKEYSRAYVFRLIDKAENKGELVGFDTGIYYMPTKSIIGISTITAEDVVNKKYIGYKDDVYGVYSGLNLQNMFSVTTQMPNTIEIVSNNESMRCRKIMIDGRTIILRKSRCKIDRTNVGAYTILQLISDMGIDEDMDDRAKDSISKYMRDNSVNNAALLSLARSFPAQTTKKLMYSGVLNGFTQ